MLFSLAAAIYSHFPSFPTAKLNLLIILLFQLFFFSYPALTFSCFLAFIFIFYFFHVCSVVHFQFCSVRRRVKLFMLHLKFKKYFRWNFLKLLNSLKRDFSVFDQFYLLVRLLFKHFFGNFLKCLLKFENSFQKSVYCLNCLMNTKITETIYIK